eukprot:2434440-Alexandrium_andersonii.AAC.1
MRVTTVATHRTPTPPSHLGAGGASAEAQPSQLDRSAASTRGRKGVGIPGTPDDRGREHFVL